jgi:hypothetical protein
MYIVTRTIVLADAHIDDHVTAIANRKNLSCSILRSVSRDQAIHLGKDNAGVILKKYAVEHLILFRFNHFVQI